MFLVTTYHLFGDQIHQKNLGGVFFFHWNPLYGEVCPSYIYCTDLNLWPGKRSLIAIVEDKAAIYYVLTFNPGNRNF